MLTILKKLFGKAAPKADLPIHAAALAPSAPMPTVEVAHLSLAAIIHRLRIPTSCSKPQDSAGTQPRP